MKIRHFIFIALLTALSGCGALGQCSSNDIKLDPAVLTSKKIDRKEATKEIIYGKYIDYFGGGFTLNLTTENDKIGSFEATFYPAMFNVSWDYGYNEIDGVNYITDLYYQYYMAVFLESPTLNIDYDWPFLVSQGIPSQYAIHLTNPIAVTNDNGGQFIFKSLYNVDNTWQGQFTDFYFTAAQSTDSTDRDFIFTLSLQWKFQHFNGNNIIIQDFSDTQDVQVTFTNIMDSIDNVVPDYTVRLDEQVEVNNDLISPWVVLPQNPETNIMDIIYPTIYYKIAFSEIPLLSESQQYKQGFNAGRDAGYNQGINHQLVFPDFLNGVFNSMNNILQVEIFPNVRLWYIFGIPLILGVIGFIIGFFRGGQ